MTQASPTSPALTELNQTLRRVDISVLGMAISRLPTAQWRERMLFMGVSDQELRQHTLDRFPATLRLNKDTHPVFVVRTRASGHLLCPCTSRKNNSLRYIRKGCILKPGNHTLDRDTYLVETCSFTMPIDGRFSRRLYYKGRVPAGCIQGSRP